MRRHHGRQAHAEPVVGLDVFFHDLRQAAVVDRQRQVRVALHVAMAGEMFAAVSHAGQRQAMIQTLCQQGDYARIAMESAFADHAGLAEIKIEHRCKRQVDATGAQLAGQHKAHRGRRFGRAQYIPIPLLPEQAHCRQTGKTIGSETLHPAAFVVDRDQYAGARRMNRCSQGGKLGAVLVITREQDHASGERMLDATDIVGAQAGANHVQHDRAECRLVYATTIDYTTA